MEIIAAAPGVPADGMKAEAPNAANDAADALKNHPEFCAVKRPVACDGIGSLSSSVRLASFHAKLTKAATSGGRGSRVPYQ